MCIGLWCKNVNFCILVVILFYVEKGCVYGFIKFYGKWGKYGVM